MPRISDEPSTFAKITLFEFGGVHLPQPSGCSGDSSVNNTGGGGGGGSTSSTPNVQAITVNTGPSAAPPLNSPYIDGAFTSVTVCAPGSTTSCQTISGILVDTGSSGLRILSSALTISLPQQTASNGNPIVECLPFVDGITWGPVQTADMTIAGEQAKSLPIQVIGSSNFLDRYRMLAQVLGRLKMIFQLWVPTAFWELGLMRKIAAWLARVSGGSNPGLYYACPATGCEVTAESLSKQVQNPIVLFPTDNNGVIIELPSVTGAEASVSGSMIFGIGTQSNNELGSATVYTVDPSSGNFTTVFNNVTYENAGFLDTGSNAHLFPEFKHHGIADL